MGEPGKEVFGLGGIGDECEGSGSPEESPDNTGLTGGF